MFVSSYSTYIDSPALKKAQNERETPQKNSAAFSEKPLQEAPQDLKLSQSLPLTYISDYKTLNTKQQINQQLEQQTQNSSNTKFTKLNAQVGAKVSYVENSTLFSNQANQKPSINLTPKLDRNLPQTAQVSQEGHLRNKMVNTYQANENYYQITAA